MLDKWCILPETKRKRSSPGQTGQDRPVWPETEICLPDSLLHLPAKEVLK